MKAILYIAIFLCAVSLYAMKESSKRIVTNNLEGAWSFEYNGNEYSLLFADGYFMLAQFNKPYKKFIETYGGPYTIKNDELQTKIEFNSANKEDVGKWHQYNFKLMDNILTIVVDGNDIAWKRIDAGDKNLAGNWRITGRKQDDKLVDIPLRPRRTLKLLTAKRFQWAAINIETGEFFGTGGGSYTFENGTYTEQIEFFSRDSSRVGIHLNFDGKIENGNWIHTGKSSKGDPIYEVWARMK